MLALKIIGGIVLFFCLLMLIPVGARAIYSEDGLFGLLWLISFSRPSFLSHRDKPNAEAGNFEPEKQAIL